MTVKIYSYSKCSTCRQAIKFLETHGLDYKAVDITATPPSRDELGSMFQAVGGELRKLLNTSGQIYRELQLSRKLPQLSSDEVMNLLATNGKLIKRPFLLVNGRGVAVGFDPEKWGKLLAI